MDPFLQSGKMMAFTIRELEHKNGELRERLKATQQLREALARAQERLEESEAIAREAHAARAEAAKLADTVRSLEARLKGTAADKEAALQGLRFEVERCKAEAQQAEVPLVVGMRARQLLRLCGACIACSAEVTSVNLWL